MAGFKRTTIGDADDASIRANVHELTNSNALGVAVVDSNGDIVAGFGAGLTDTELRATPVPVSVGSALPDGDNNIGNVDIVTLPSIPSGTNNIGDVDVLSLPAIPAGNNNIGDVDIASIAAGDNNIGNVDIVTMPSIPAGTNNIGDVDVLTLPAIPAGTNRIGSVRPVDSSDGDLTSVTGTQTSRFLGVQNVTDAGRVNLQYWATAVAAGSTGTETAITLNRRPDTGAGTSAASFVVTNGKRFRMTSITFASRGNATATIQVTTFSIRVNTGGAVTTSSTPIILQARTATPATASAWDRFTISAADSPEILGDGTMQFGVTANAVYTTNAPTWDVLITGYEY